MNVSDLIFLKRVLDFTISTGFPVKQCINCTTIRKRGRGYKNEPIKMQYVEAEKILVLD